MIDCLCVGLVAYLLDCKFDSLCACLCVVCACLGVCLFGMFILCVSSCLIGLCLFCHVLCWLFDWLFVSSYVSLFY